MKQGETGMSFRHAPGKFLVIGRFLEKIVSALLPFLTMLVSARFTTCVKSPDGGGDPRRLACWGL